MREKGEAVFAVLFFLTTADMLLKVGMSEWTYCLKYVHVFVYCRYFANRERLFVVHIFVSGALR